MDLELTMKKNSPAKAWTRIVVAVLILLGTAELINALPHPSGPPRVASLVILALFGIFVAIRMCAWSIGYLLYGEENEYYAIQHQLKDTQIWYDSEFDYPKTVGRLLSEREEHLELLETCRVELRDLRIREAMKGPTAC
jgi:hypothetical protein